MFPFKIVKIRSFEVGLAFRDGEYLGLLREGTHWFLDPRRKVVVDVVSRRTPQLYHSQLDILVRSGDLKGEATVIDLKDGQRALVWVDGRFNGVLPPGLYAYWLAPAEVRIELVDARGVRFEHEDLTRIARTSTAQAYLDLFNVGRGGSGVLFIDGRYADLLGPGLYAFWKGVADVRVVEVDLRETSLDVSGQEIMTADKVTLRLNALVTYRVDDPRKAVCSVDDAKSALYREAQLALRAVVGARDLDALLGDKDVVAREVEEGLRRRAAELGLSVLSAGVRDIILPGDMKELMNKVTEARKAAEANIVTRREETAAYRSQANTAKLLADNPVLMRLRELEALEKIASTGHLSVMLGEQGLTHRVVNLL